MHITKRLNEFYDSFLAFFIRIIDRKKFQSNLSKCIKRYLKEILHKTLAAILTLVNMHVDESFMGTNNTLH